MERMANINSSMPGKITEIKVKVGDTVTKGQELCTIEAMKMQMPVTSPQDGTVSDIKVAIGQSVKKGDPLIVLG
jgi:biotin carboxyl carrier protein